MLAAVTLFASCSQEEIVTKTDGESLVSFTVTTPELGSRAAEEATTPAIGTGATATDLYYAVYDETIGEIVTTLSKTAAAETITAGASKEISLPLLNGHKYSLLFWAENAEGAYKIDFATKSISLKKENFTLTSNNENYDAFYAYVEPFTVTGTKTSSVQLKRPFAQLNIGTTFTDLKNVKNYYKAEFAQSTIVVTTATSMDLTTGKVSGEKALTYAAADFIASEKMKETYEYLSMNYLLVSNEKNLVDVKFSVSEKKENGKVISKTFNNVPVQRNYKTNIYGDLFTSSTTWNVELKPGFEDEIEPAGELAALFEQGGEMTLYTDVTLTEPLILTEDKTVTINLNGNTITGGLFAESNGVISTGTSDSYPFWVKGGTLNIKGEGRVVAQDCDYSMAVYATGGVVNIYSGEYYNQGDACDLIYAGGNAEVNIHGGYFKATLNNGADGTKNEHSALNLKDADRNTAHINVLGGTFYKFNPANNVSEGKNTNFVKEGYTSVQVGDNFVVAKGTATAEALVAALNEGGVVALVHDVTTAAKASLKAGSTLDGGNNTLLVGGNDLSAYFVPAGTTGTLRFIETAGDATIQNMTIDGNKAAYEKNCTNYGIRGIFLTGAGTVTIDNVTIKNVTYCLNDDAAEKTLNVSNSTFEGWTSYNPKTTANFTNTNFKKATYGTLRPYATTTFENCDFAEGFVVDVYHYSTDKDGNIILEQEYQPNIVFKNCTYAGQPLTGKDSKLFETADAAKMDKVTIL